MLLELEGATVRFGGLVAVDSVSLSVMKGSIIGLIGPNGAGKTTLFNAISGLQSLSGGRIWFDSADITRTPAHGRARIGIGRTFQHLGLVDSQSVISNALGICHSIIGYRSSAAVLHPFAAARAETALRKRVEQALVDIGLAEHRDGLVAELSFGAARRLECATVLAQMPKLVLLDEPTTGLDPAECTWLLETVREYRGRGGTVVVVAHDISFVRQACDVVYVLAEGRIIYRGDASGLAHDEGVVAKYLGRRS